MTRWIQQLKEGDETAASELWRRYFNSLVRVARGSFGGTTRSISDEEDVALSAIKSVFLGARRGALSELTNRVDLWLLLFVITQQKTADVTRWESRKKRGGGFKRESIERTGISDLLSKEPTPEFAIELKEEMTRLLGLLDSEAQRKAAVMRLEGYSNEEIAAALQRTQRTVERWHQTARLIWEQELRRWETTNEH